MRTVTCAWAGVDGCCILPASVLMWFMRNIRSGYLYETTFKKEVLSDLTGERGVLMGAIQGLFLAQYEVSSFLDTDIYRTAVSTPYRWLHLQTFFCHGDQNCGRQTSLGHRCLI